jgi:parallel beta-helix repeat protein
MRVRHFPRGQCLELRNLWSRPHLTTQWADGISLSCQSSLVQNNVIVDATDGGIVIFGAPFSVIRNNTIGVKTRTTLGGINRESKEVRW